jgi:hypothetical protein
VGKNIWQNFQIFGFTSDLQNFTFTLVSPNSIGMVLTESMATTWQHKSGVECHYFTIYVVLS